MRIVRPVSSARVITLARDKRMVGFGMDKIMRWPAALSKLRVAARGVDPGLQSQEMDIRHCPRDPALKESENQGGPELTRQIRGAPTTTSLIWYGV